MDELCVDGVLELFVFVVVDEAEVLVVAADLVSPANEASGLKETITAATIAKVIRRLAILCYLLIGLSCSGSPLHEG
jgi:hypothetical protein